MEKILFVTNDFPPQSGGIQTFIEGLIRQFPRDSVVVHASSQKPIAQQERFDQSIFEELGVIVVRDRQRILLPTFGLRKRVAGTIHAHSIQQVVFGASVPLGILAPALRKLGVKRIIALTHGHEVWWAKMPVFAQILRHVAKHVNYLTFLGSFTRSAISSAIRAEDARKLIHLPPGVDVQTFHPGSKSDQLIARYQLENKRVILCVGRLVQRKGQDVLIRALAHIRDQVPNVHLVIAGTGNYREKLEEIVRRSKLESNVTFVGRIPYNELVELFRTADIFASPTRDRFAGLEVEGLGIVYLEASASGLPVIAGDSGGSPDAVQPGKTGLVVNGRDVEAVARALTTLLEDRTLAQSMGENGRLWMESQWSWQVIGQRFRQLLELN